MLKEAVALWKKERNKKGTTLHRRLLLFFVSLTIVLILVFTLLLSLFGITGKDEKTVNNYIDAVLTNTADKIEDDFGAMSLDGINMAEAIAEQCDGFFQVNGITAAELPEHPEMIQPLLAGQMQTLINMASNRYCGGVFIMLDATVDPAAEDAETSKAGVFLKKTQPTQTTSLGVYIDYLRGPAPLAREHGLMLLGQWKMEYDISGQEFFTTVMQTARDNPDQPLSRLYYWSGRILLKGNSEAGFMLCVPLRSEDGTVFGLCGIEMSDRLFKTLYQPDSGTYDVFAIVAPDCEDGLGTSKGMIAGSTFLTTGARWENDLTDTGRSDGFTYYSGANGKYAGKTAGLRLYTANSLYENENWSAAILMPQSVLSDAVKGSVSYFIGIVIVLLILSIIASVVISRKYISPVTEALEQVKNKSYTENGSNGRFSEINDLFEFLVQQDREHEEAVSSLDEQHRAEVEAHEKTKGELARVAGEAKQSIDPDSYALFVGRLATLTKREREVFDLYIEGKKAKEIMEILALTDNGLKFHNKNIYSKLGVSSRKELLKYVAIIKHEQGGNV